MKTAPPVVRPVIRTVLHSRHYEKLSANLKIPPSHIPVSSRVASLLDTSTWAVRSLLPDPNPASSTEDKISREKLHHLLRLSALPSPKTVKEEAKLLRTLEGQIHFVKEIQKIDTSAVEPLQAIRDTTAEAIDEDTISLRDLKPYLDEEDKVGKNGRVRRRKIAEDHGEENADTWHPFDMSMKRSKKYGKHFAVKRSKQA